MAQTPEEFLKEFENSRRCSCGHSQEKHTKCGTADLGHGTTMDYTDGCTECRCEEFIEQSHPYWQCQECGYENKLKAMPKMSPTEWYGRRKPEVCPRCKSEAFQPTGW